MLSALLFSFRSAPWARRPKFVGGIPVHNCYIVPGAAVPYIWAKHIGKDSRMNIAIKFVLFQLAILLPFVAGWLLQNSFTDPRQFTGKLLRMNIIGIEPLIVFWCVWGLDVSFALCVLPVAGLGLVFTGLGLGRIAARLLGLSGTAKQTFLLGSSLSNHGFTMGGFLCYFFLGEAGLGLAMIFIVYFIPYIYCCVFPSAKIASGGGVVPSGFLKGVVFDRKNMPLFAILLAAGTNMLGIRRPAIFFPVDLLLFISIILYYLTLGINFTGFSLRGRLKEQAVVCAIKFLAVPLMALAVVSMLPLAPPIKAVILIQACMPVAIYTVVTSVLFNLDTGFASGMMVVNTLFFLCVVLPVLILLRDALMVL